MKTEFKIFAWFVPFLVVITVVYGVFTEPLEWVGFTALSLTTLFCAFIAWFLWMWGRKLDLRPDDNPEGEIEDQAGDYGFFSPHSWWPLFVGFFSALVFLGVAVGWWITILAAPFAAWAVIGWTFEYFRGDNPA